MKKLLTLIFFTITKLSCAQDSSILKPLLNQHEQSSARSMGVAGAFGAVGADGSNATHNPAGIAFYRKKEVALGLGLRNHSNKTNFLNSEKSSTLDRGDFNNFNYVFSNLMTKREKDSLKVYRQGLVGTAFTIGVNKKGDFNEQISYEGYNEKNSLLSSYSEYANAVGKNSTNDLSEFEQQAIKTNLLQSEVVNGQYRYSSELEQGNVEQKGNRIRNGSIYDLHLGTGLNFNNKLYLGATVGFPIYSFREKFSYTEEDTENKYATFQQLELKENRNYSGIGSYLRVGGIYRISDFVRAGVHFKTPSAILINENSLIATSNSELSAEQNYKSEYRLTTPLETGLQFVASHPAYGFISLEGDYTNNRSKLKYEDELGSFTKNESQYQEEIKRTHKGSFNGKIGIEFRIARQFRLRGGFAHYGSPYRQKELQYGAKTNRQLLGLGIGYRDIKSNFTFDLGYNYQSTGEFESAYLYQNQPNTILTNKENHNFKIGISKRFNY